MKNSITIFLAIFFCISGLFSRDLYRTNSSGNWSEISIWERFDGTTWIPATHEPTSADSIVTILNGHEIIIDGPSSAYAIRVMPGASLKINVFASGSGGNDLTVNPGNLVNSGYMELGAYNVITGVSVSVSSGATMNWLSGTVRASLNNSSTLNITGDDPKFLDGNMGNMAVLNWTDRGQLYLTNCSFLNLGVVNEYFTANNGFVDYGGSNEIINQGQLFKHSSFDWNVPIALNNEQYGSLHGQGKYLISSHTGVFRNLFPGDPTGILSLPSDFVDNKFTEFSFSILDGSGAGTGHDRIDLTGGAVDISQSTIVAEASTSAPLQAYTIMTAPGPNGFIGNFMDVVIPNGYTLSIDNTSNPSTVNLTKTTITLPVVWGAFNVFCEGPAVVLEWNTYDEINTEKFVIEHSIDGQSFTNVGTVPALRGHNVINEYRYTHITPRFNFINYYRIRSIDSDGKTGYSMIRSISICTEVKKLIKIPSPVKNVLLIQALDDNISVDIVDNSGRLVAKSRLEPGSNFINIQNLRTGVYFVIIYHIKGKAGALQVMIE